MAGRSLLRHFCAPRAPIKHREFFSRQALNGQRRALSRQASSATSTIFGVAPVEGGFVPKSDRPEPHSSPPGFIATVDEDYPPPLCSLFTLISSTFCFSLYGLFCEDNFYSSIFKLVLYAFFLHLFRLLSSSFLLALKTGALPPAVFCSFRGGLSLQWVGCLSTGRHSRLPLLLW